MHNEDELLLSLTSLLIVRKMVVIVVDWGLLLVSLSHMKKNTTTNVDTRARLVEAWEMTLWAKHWTRSPSHPSRVRLKGQYFLGDFISQHSPFIMVERTLWNMWATSIREWLSIPRTKPWCARYSHLVWDLGDEMVQRPKGQFYRFLQGAHLCIWLLFHYVYQGPLAHRFPTVLIHVRRRNFERLLG